MALDDATSAPPDRPPGCIRYQRDSEQIYNSRVAINGSEVGRTKLLVWLMACMVVAITAAACLWYAGINVFAGHWGRANSGLILGAVFLAWFWFGPMIRTARHGVIMAPNIHTPWSEDEPMQIVLSAMDRHGGLPCANDVRGPELWRSGHGRGRIR